jgi:hypothetical protein
MSKSDEASIDTFCAWQQAFAGVMPFRYRAMRNKRWTGIAPRAEHES